MTPSDFIRRGWTQGDFARDHNGNSVHFSSPNAVCWCAVGAVKACYRGAGQYDAMQLLRNTINRQYIDHWNDDRRRTKRSVLKVFESIPWPAQDRT
jgi:hypothetical protein